MSRFFSVRYAALVLIALMSFASGALAQSAFDDPGARGGGGQGGDLKPVSEKVDAGSVALGAAAQVVVLLRNDDAKPIKAGAINLYPSSNISATVGENQCAADAIAPGEICAISIQIKGLQSGKFRVEMLIRHDGRAKLLTSTIEGTVDNTGVDSKDLVSDLEIIPNAIDFGTLAESRPQMKAMIFRNKTSKPIKVDDIQVAAGSQSGFSVESNCGDLPVGAACVASVTWSPEQRGPASGTIIVKHNGSTGVSTVELKGAYDPDVAETAKVFPDAIPGKGLLVSSQEEIDFGGGVTQSASITVSLVNVGDVPLTITGIRMANSENGVRAEKGGCQAGAVLTPLEACPLTMTWDPVREGNVVDDVQILHTGARGILVMPLRGKAAKAVNKDSKAILLGGPGPEAIISNIQPLSMDDVEDDGQTSSGGKSGYGNSRGKSGERAILKADVSGILDGYTITSYSSKRAIVAGPGGSRVVFDGEQAVIGGILWTILIRPSAVEFQHGEQKVLLLFDRSLSPVSNSPSVNLLNTQSTGGESAASAAAPAASSATSSSTPSQ